MLFNVFLTILLTTMTHQGRPDTRCGPYGFQCLNLKDFLICPIIDSDGNTEAPNFPISCKKGYICDEENPAYCTPYDAEMGTTNSDRVVREDNVEYYDDDIANLFFAEEPTIERSVRNKKGDSCGCPTTTTAATTTVTTEGTTIFTTPLAPPFNCMDYGFFPDRDDKTMFWYCDISWNGKGYEARHMQCGKDRVFNAMRQACILNDWVSVDEQERLGVSRRSAKSKFSCAGKHDGFYENTDNCQKYHVCNNKKTLPLSDIMLTCPKNTAFDPAIKKCSHSAMYRCVKDKNVAGKHKGKGHGTFINCKSPSRFRDSRDCGGYYLCYGNQLLEMRCPNDYRFDDGFLECLPQNMAKCEESN